MTNIGTQLSRLLANTGDMALKRRANKIVTNINPQPRDSIIDVGCGDGYYLHLLSNLHINNISLTGVDNDILGLIKTKKNIYSNKTRILTGDLMKKLPFPNNCFNKAIMSEVVEHLPDDVKGLKEVYRILKPGGILCLTVPHANYPFLWDPINWILERTLKLHVKSGFFAGIWNQHLRLYYPKQIRYSLEKAGFTINRIEAVTFWCLPFNHQIVNLVARYIHQRYTKGISSPSLDKFNSSSHQSKFVKYMFLIVNYIDKLNDLLPIKSSGVSIFVIATK